MKAIPLVILVLALAVVAVGGDTDRKDSDMPKEGYVPNKEVAIKIAVAVWEPIHGADHIAREAPFRAKLDKGVWLVEGSLPAGMRGGVAVAEISQEDGRILRVSHGK